ncbi:MAG: cyclic pyranopterin monophosphate synthase MoaC [Dehalococcoidia bacterium]
MPEQTRMIDVSDKSVTKRVAIAKGRVLMLPATLSMLKNDKLPKGGALTVAQVAGIMAAKNTSQLIPMCHPLILDEVKIDFEFSEKYVDITAQVKCTGKTGVEMEALTAVAVAALTIYDMCKAIEKGIRIENIRLVKKSGGKSGEVVLE